jgi:hypothetical protein
MMFGQSSHFTVPANAGVYRLPEFGNHFLISVLPAIRYNAFVMQVLGK